MMKILVFTLALIASTFGQAKTNAPDCTWTDPNNIYIALFSKPTNGSKGWIFCEKANLTSIILERHRGTSKQWIDKYAKESIPDAEKIIERGTKVMIVAHQKVKRIIVKVKASSETYDMAFFFLKKEGRQYVFSTTFLERPFKKDLKVATREVQKVVRTQPKLFKN